MEFDKSKVFAPFNCEEVKIGSKGYFADNKETLIKRVQSEDKDFYLTLQRIENGDFSFGINDIKGGGLFRYFYLVEEPMLKRNMKFDKSNVYTPFNCEEVKIGSIGYYSNSKETLISRVQSDDKDHYGVLKNICDNTNDDYVFLVNNCARYRYFYLIEELKEKTKRPCVREELLEMLKRQGLPMLLYKDRDTVYNFLYLQNKTLTVVSSKIEKCINYSYEDLCKNFTLLDGSELWVEE